MKFFMILLFVFLQNVNFGHAQACAYSQFGLDHTMCKYTAKACPAGLLESGLTEADKIAALSTHNTVRQKVANGQQYGQPSASNMEEMKWDPELAVIAQRWADQCSYGLDENRRTSTFSYVGQNAVMTGSTAPGGTTDFTNAVNVWYNKVTWPGFSSSNISPFRFSQAASPYTQLVWAESNRLGCGYSYYKNDGYYNRLYICNYGPGGNLYGGGLSMYKIGPAASDCSKGKSTSYVGLCNS